MSRLTREMFCLMEGRHVHPSTLYPGGVGTVATRAAVHRLPRRASCSYIDFVKRVVPLHDDLFDFFYEALPGYDEVGQRRILLGCWGAFQDPEVCDFTLRGHDRVGARDVRHARRRRRRQAGHQRSRRDQPRHPHPARQLVLRGLAGRARCSSPTIRSATRSTRAIRGTRRRSPHAAEARLRRQVQLGHVAALVRRQGSPRARHRRRTDRAPVVDGALGPGRHRLRQGDRHSVVINLPQDGVEAGGALRVEDPEVVQHDRARSRALVLPGLRRRAARCTSSSKALARAARRATTRPGRRSRCPKDAIGCGFTEAVRGVLVAPPGDSRRQDRQLPPVSADAVEREPARQLRHARARTRTRCRGSRSSRRTAATTSRASTSCARCAASIPACRAACTCTPAGASSSRSTRPSTSRPSSDERRGGGDGGAEDEPREHAARIERLLGDVRAVGGPGGVAARRGAGVAAGRALRRGARAHAASSSSRRARSTPELRARLAATSWSARCLALHGMHPDAAAGAGARRRRAGARAHRRRGRHDRAWRSTSAAR